MLEKLREWIMRMMGIKMEEMPSEPDRHRIAYETAKEENITATIAAKLAMLTFADSVSTVDGDGMRAEMIEGILMNLWNDGAKIAAQCMGKGGKVIMPFVHDGHIDITIGDQTRLAIRRMDGSRILAASIILSSWTHDDKLYYLLADYDVRGDVHTIRYKATDSEGNEVELHALEPWAEIEPEIVIRGVDRVLLGFLRCPRDNRKENQTYGVPITFGAENSIRELMEHMKIYRREFLLTRPMLGLDSTLWRSFGGDDKPFGIKEVRKTVQDGDDPFIPVETTSLDAKTPWQHYAPNIRVEAMEKRYNSLARRVEKDCGLSQGILTERQSLNYANKDEVRAAQYDTFSTIKAMRDEWERCMADVAYAVDVLAEAYGLTPAGSRNSYAISYDWDQSLIESTAETFAQMTELHSTGLISDAELRAWETGESIEDAQAWLDEHAEERKNPVDELLKNIGTPAEE